METKLCLTNIVHVGRRIDRDMKKCVWTRPERVDQIEFLEWTDSDHLRHSKFSGLREDKDPKNVAKEHAVEAIR